MAKDNRRIITWSLNATRDVYQDDLKKYYHKIYSIGLHEFGVTAEGKIYDFRSERNYFDASGNHTGVRFPIIMENNMIQYPSIKWYLQMVLFGWSKVKPVLDNNVRNAEGRYPQDQFILELGKILDLYKGSRNSGTPLGLTGVEMDVEASMTSDYTSQGHDEKYIRLLERIKNEVLIPRGMKLRINAYAMWGNQTPYYYRFHNYKLFAESTARDGKATIDEIQLMTYDFAWSGSSAGASTPIWWFRQVAEWCKQCFDPQHNPKAKLTIDKLFFGAAGYGNRWGMHDQEVVKRGSTVTFRNLLGWQNGQYRHYHTETSETGWTNPQTGEKYRNSDGTITKTRYVYHNQPYLFQASFQDEESKNEVMYPHVYDIFHPKYVNVKTIDGGRRTATVGTYNRLDYAATNFKLQDPIWTNVVAIANRPSSFSGKAYPIAVEQSVKKYAEDKGIDVKDLPDNMRQQWDTNLDPNDVNFQHLIKTVNGRDEVFVGWRTQNLIYREHYEYDKLGNVIGASCVLEDKQEGRINYTVNVPSSGNYKLVAITNFSWFTQSKIGGYVNGSQRFTVGGDNLPDWFPFFLKGSFFYDCGRFSFNAGSNSISVHGELSHQNTTIYGFVICQDFDQNFTGGELTLNTNIQPMFGKDGNQAPLPKRFALAAKMLRRDARPAILWDDEFRTYDEGTFLAGNPRLETTYYRSANPNYRVEGGGTYVEQDGVDPITEQPIYKCYSTPTAIGYSQGIWKQCNYRLHFNSDETEAAIGVRSGQCVLSKQWSANLSIEATIQVVSGSSAGIRFHAQKQGSAGDGYIFLANFKDKKIQLIYENNGVSRVVAEQNLGNISHGINVRYRVISHNGKGIFYVGGVQVFKAGDGNPVTHDGSVNTATGEVSLIRNGGAVGIYANDCELNCTHLGIGTTDRWETMEKFEVIVDGVKKEFGRINRTGYSYDEYGYLIYSGLNEKQTRDAVQYPFEEDSESVSLDYEVTVLDWESWRGAKEVKIKLLDAGVWFGELLIGDREGMSIIWAGDAWSFLDAMNMAVNDYGAKGIGLWTMGQEDPFLFELVPDVVPKK